MSYKEAMQLETSIANKGISSEGDSSCEITDSSASSIADDRQIPSVCE